MKRTAFWLLTCFFPLYAGSDSDSSSSDSTSCQDIVPARSRGGSLVAVHEHVSTREGSYDLEAVRIDVEALPVHVSVEPPPNTRSNDLLLAIQRKKVCIALIGCIGVSITASTALVIVLVNKYKE